MIDETPQLSSAPAWQPLTFGGVARFGSASLARLLTIQLIVALLVSGTVVWCLATRYAPSITEAIQKMPETAILERGVLKNIPEQTLVETRFFSIVMDLEGNGEIGQSADLQFEFHRNHVRVCSLLRSALGCLTLSYPQNVAIPLGREQLEPWWGAWKPMLLAGCGAAVLFVLLLTWALLALLYAPIVWLLAYYMDRELPTFGCWKLGAAALIPGALLMELAILAYGWHALDLIGLAVATLVHVPVGWIYVSLAPLCLPRAVAPQKDGNPFSC